MTTPTKEFAHAVLKDPAGWIATGFGTGFAPYASGTVGTLAALVPWLAFRHLPLWQYLVLLVAAFALGVWAAQRVIDTIEVQDPGIVVWDEFVGLWIALTAAPAGWEWAVGGFVLFRFFDILKPWPVSWADNHCKGGVGAMLDDAFAGFYALVMLQTIAYLADVARYSS